MGHEEVLGPNEIQRMSAGSGVIHSEYNASDTQPVHFLQIWIEPATNGTPTSYEQLRFEAEEKRGKLKLLAGPRGGDGAAVINQNAQVFVAELAKGEQVDYPIGSRRHAWLHVIRGAVNVNGTPLQTGDAAAVSNEETLKVAAAGAESSEILLFDLA